MTLLFESAGLIAWGGVFIISLLIFAETGLLLGLIIPGGETLVFTSGILVSANTLHLQIIPLLAILIGCGFAGDYSGYQIGKKYGQRLYAKEDTWYFKKRYLTLAESFFNKHRKTAILLGKFMPVIRPFSPLMAGMSGMKAFPFLTISFLSVIIHECFPAPWILLGKSFPGHKKLLRLDPSSKYFSFGSTSINTNTKK